MESNGTSAPIFKQIIHCLWHHPLQPKDMNKNFHIYWTIGNRSPHEMAAFEAAFTLQTAFQGKSE